MSDWSRVSIEARRAEQIRRRSHLVLAGASARRPSAIESAVVSGFALTLFVWALRAVVTLG